VRNLKQEIEKFHLNPARKLVIKMDIEGAEWKTLGNPHVLQSLNAHNATLLLAVHPGFAKPMPKWATRILISRIPWLINQFNDSLNLYNNLSKHAEILRTNHNPVLNRFKFAMLIIAGYHEYIIRFNK
jgi:hypothetical protein